MRAAIRYEYLGIIAQRIALKDKQGLKASDELKQKAAQILLQLKNNNGRTVIILIVKMHIMRTDVYQFTGRHYFLTGLGRRNKCKIRHAC